MRLSPAPGLGRRRTPAICLLTLLTCLLALAPAALFAAGPLRHGRCPAPPRGELTTTSLRATVPWGAPRLPRHRTSLQSLPTAAALPSAPFAPPGGSEAAAGSQGPRDFFLFIKDYGWSLRYRVGLAAGEATLREDKPLEMEWVKLLKPIHNPAELLEPSSWRLFDWDVVEPPRHEGFMYQVTRAIGTAVEAVINFFKGQDLRLLVSAERGIEILRPVANQAADEPHAVTHCWVEMGGLPFLPSLQSIAFYDLNQVVLDWQA